MLSNRFRTSWCCCPRNTCFHCQALSHPHDTELKRSPVDLLGCCCKWIQLRTELTDHRTAMLTLCNPSTRDDNMRLNLIFWNASWAGNWYTFSAFYCKYLCSCSLPWGVPVSNLCRVSVLHCWKELNCELKWSLNQSIHPRARNHDDSSTLES